MEEAGLRILLVNLRKRQATLVDKINDKGKFGTPYQ